MKYLLISLMILILCINSFAQKNSDYIITTEKFSMVTYDQIEDVKSPYQVYGHSCTFLISLSTNRILQYTHSNNESIKYTYYDILDGGGESYIIRDTQNNNVYRIQIKDKAKIIFYDTNKQFHFTETYF